MLGDEQLGEIYTKLNKTLNDGCGTGQYKDKFSSALDAINTIIEDYHITDASDVKMVIDSYNNNKWNEFNVPFH